MGTRYIIRSNTRTTQDITDIVIMRSDGTAEGTQVLDPEQGWIDYPPGNVLRPTFSVTAPGHVDSLVFQRYGWIDAEAKGLV